MKIKVITMLMVTGCILFIQSCATAPTPDITAVDITAAPSPDQKVGYDGTLFSQKKHSLSLTPYTDFDSAIPEFDLAANKAKFMLTVQNGGKAPVTIGYDNISATIEEDGNDGKLKTLSIQSLDAFMEDFEKEYNNNEKKFLYSKFYNYYHRLRTRIRFAEMNGEMNGEQGILSESQQIEVITLEDWEDRLQELIWDLERMRRSEEGLREALQRGILTQQTIMPGSSYTGIFICDTSDLDPRSEVKFRIAVSVDGEEHVFSFHWGF